MCSTCSAPPAGMPIATGGCPTTWLSGTRCAGGLSMQTSLEAEVVDGPKLASTPAGCVAGCVTGP
eukprot:8396424-Lingulodinium_polyedra.AAC.1